MREGQVLIFGIDDEASEALRDDEDFAHLLESGTAVTSPKPLGDLLDALADRYELKELADTRLVEPAFVTLLVREHTPDRIEPVPEGHHGSLRSLEVSRQDWQGLNESFEILHDLKLSRTRHRLTIRDLPSVPRVPRAEPRPSSRPGATIRVQAAYPRRPSPAATSGTLERPLTSGLCANPCRTERLGQDDADVAAGGQPSRGGSARPVHSSGGRTLPDLNQIDQFAVKLEAVAKIPIVILYDGLVADYEYLKVAQVPVGPGPQGSGRGHKLPYPPSQTLNLKVKRRAGHAVNDVPKRARCVKSGGGPGQSTSRSR